MLSESLFFGVCVSLLGYQLGLWLRKRTGLAIFQPLLVATALVLALLNLLGLDYATYNQSAQYLKYLLTPATACLAIPLYEQIGQLKAHFMAIALGVAAGVLACMATVLALSLLFRLDHQVYVSLLPKSITTAMALGVTEELGGVPSITAAAIMVTGLMGNMMAELLCKLFRIRHPVAKGVAIGASSHAMGTSRALEIGQVEGAMSSLSIAVCGLLTVAIAPIFATLY